MKEENITLGILRKSTPDEQNDFIALDGDLNAIMHKFQSDVCAKFTGAVYPADIKVSPRPFCTRCCDRWLTTEFRKICADKGIDVPTLRNELTIKSVLMQRIDYEKIGGHENFELKIIEPVFEQLYSGSRDGVDIFRRMESKQMKVYKCKKCGKQLSIEIPLALENIKSRELTR